MFHGIASVCEFRDKSHEKVFRFFVLETNIRSNELRVLRAIPNNLTLGAKTDL